MKKINLASLLLLLTFGAQAGLPPVTITGENYLSKPALNKIRANPVNLAGTNVTGVLPVAKGGSTGTNTGDQTITLTGDLTGSGTGSFATTLATVNASPGTTGSASSTSVLTTNGKGLVTANSSTPIQVTESQVTSLVSDLALKAPLASPNFTGTVSAPTFSGALSGNATTATTATTAGTISGSITESQVTNLVSDLALKSPLASPTFTGTVTAPTFSGALSGNATTATTAGTISGSITEAQVTNLVSDLALKSPLASPTFTGTVTIPSGASLGTPTTLVGTNITGTASALNIGGNAATATLASTVTTNANLTGPITSVGNATSVTNNAITDAMLAQVATATFRGRATAGTGNVEVLTATQATALLNSMVGDSGSGGTKGLVPAPSSGDGAAGKVLKANGTWGAASPLTTKGDTYIYSTTNSRLPVGTDYQAIIADSNAANGLRYAKQYQGPKNYITYGDFENQASTGWTTIGCASLVNGLPTSVGSSGAAFSSSNGGRTKGANTADISGTVQLSGPLAGIASGALITIGAGTIGDGHISSAYPIDIEDQAKVMSYKVRYQVTNGTPNMSGTSANTYAVAIYSPADNAWLPVAGAFNFVQSSGVGIAQGTFQTNITTTSVQIFIYSPVAPTGTSGLYFDSVYVGPQSLAFGPAVSDWTSQTMTITGSTSNPTKGTNTEHYYTRRVGDSLELSYNYYQTVAGSAGSGTYLYALPAGMVIDTTKFNATGDQNVTNVGDATALNSGINQPMQGRVFVYDSTHLAVSTGTNGTNTQTSSSTFNALSNTTVTTTFNANVPISGWSSSSVQSADTDTRLINAVVSGNATGTVSSTFAGSANLTFPTIDSNSAGLWGTNTFTCGVTGVYEVTGQMQISGTYLINQYGVISVAKNNTEIRQSISYAGGSESSVTVPINTQLTCSAGDTLSVRAWSNSTSPSISGGTSTNYVNFKRLSGPAVVAASESVFFQAAGAVPTGTLGASHNTVIYGTKEVDSHNAYNSTTGVYTVPVSGNYQIDGSWGTTAAAAALGNANVCSIAINGTRKRAFKRNAFLNDTGAETCAVSSKYRCLAGDTITITSYTETTTPAYNNGDNVNFFSVARVGN